jgi:hypothetical protein
MTYFQRNRRWLMPFIVICMLILAQMMLSVFAEPDPVGGKPIQVPTWTRLIAAGGCVIGAFLAGLGAMFTDTFSADIVRVAAPAGGLAVILALVGLSIPTVVIVVVVVWLGMGFIDRRRRA